MDAHTRYFTHLGVVVNGDATSVARHARGFSLTVVQEVTHRKVSTCPVRLADCENMSALASKMWDYVTYHCS